MKPMRQPPKIHRLTELYRSRLFTIEALDLEFSNGEQVVFERIIANAGRAVMVVAVTDQNEILLVREYAAGTERYELQLPKGIIDAGETGLEAANREVGEEPVFAANHLERLHCMRVAPGYFRHETEVVLARELYPQRADSGDEPEPLEVVRYPLAQIDTLLQREDFTEARSVAALLLVARMVEIEV